MKLPRDLQATAIEIVTTAGFGSASLLQRKMRIGYGLAVAILDDLEQIGLVSPGAGGSPRAVLMSASDAQAALVKKQLKEN